MREITEGNVNKTELGEKKKGANRKVKESLGQRGSDKATGQRVQAITLLTIDDSLEAGGRRSVHPKKQRTSKVFNYRGKEGTTRIVGTKDNGRQGNYSCPKD